eukprot:11194434-Lingulodinium_polyedra.AAC.1
MQTGPLGATAVPASTRRRSTITSTSSCPHGPPIGWWSSALSSSSAVAATRAGSTRCARANLPGRAIRRLRRIGRGRRLV